MRNCTTKKIQKEFDKKMGKFIVINGRPIIVNLQKIRSDCPNCINDAHFNQDESTNIYNQGFIRPVLVFPGTTSEEIIYPQPFNVTALPSGIVFDPTNTNPKILSTVVCPVCKGRGELFYQPDVCINANFNWHPRSGPADGMIMDKSPGRHPDNVGIIKTELCNFAICRDARSFIVDEGVVCEMIVPPTKKGIGEDAFVEIYVQKVDSTDSTSFVKDQDKRVNVRILGEVSDQSTSGTPHTPPTLFGNEDW